MRVVFNFEEENVTPSAPSPGPRSSAFMCSLGRSGTLIVVGGTGLTKFFNDVWLFSVASHQWELLSPQDSRNTSFMSPRGGFGAALVKQNTICLFGGRGETGLVADAFLFNLSSRLWSRFTPLAKSDDVPCPREDCCLVSHGDQEIVLLGGTDEQHRALADVWSCNLEHPVWNRVQQSGDVPSTGCAAMSCCLLPPHHAVIFGGYNGGAFSNDLACINLATYVWTRITVSAPPMPRPRTHSHLWLVEDVQTIPITETLVLFGGYAGACALDDIWALDVPASFLRHEPAANARWRKLTPASSAATLSQFARGAGACAALPLARAATSLFVFGGCDGSRFVGSIVRLDVTSVPRHTATAPKPRHHAVFGCGTVSGSAPLIGERPTSPITPTVTAAAECQHAPTIVTEEFSDLEAAVSGLKQEVHRLRSLPASEAREEAIATGSEELQARDELHAQLREENISIRAENTRLHEEIRALTEKIALLERELDIHRNIHVAQPGSSQPQHTAEARTTVGEGDEANPGVSEEDDSHQYI